MQLFTLVTDLLNQFVVCSAVQTDLIFTISGSFIIVSNLYDFLSSTEHKKREFAGSPVIIRMRMRLIAQPYQTLQYTVTL